MLYTAAVSNSCKRNPKRRELIHYRGGNEGSVLRRHITIRKKVREELSLKRP
jgi:hypothetical protein